MDLALRALSGPKAGTTFEIKGEITIGRSGQIAIEDPKVSSIHARIKADEKGRWYLYDNNSKNGIRNDAGEKIETLALAPGIRFYIGDIQFEVLEGGPAAPTPREEGKKDKKYWHDVLADFLESHSSVLADAQRPLRPLKPAVVLDFVKGVQVNSKWVLGYGPRKIGAACIDLPIWEPGAPDVCFELTSTEDGLLFKTKHPKQVLLNGKPIASQILRMGDSIRILETVIEVDFTE